MKRPTRLCSSAKSSGSGSSAGWSGWSWISVDTRFKMASTYNDRTSWLNLSRWMLKNLLIHVFVLIIWPVLGQQWWCCSPVYYSARSSSCSCVIHSQSTQREVGSVWAGELSECCCRCPLGSSTVGWVPLTRRCWLLCWGGEGGCEDVRRKKENRERKAQQRTQSTLFTALALFWQRCSVFSRVFSYLFLPFKLLISKKKNYKL